MKAPSSGTLTIFALFFLASMMDAIVTRNWWRAGFWVMIAFAFYGLDRMGRGDSERAKR